MIDSRLRGVAVAAVLLLTGPLAACGGDTDPVSAAEATGSVSVGEAWSRQPVDGQSTAAVYATVTNPTGTDLTIVAASSPVTPDVELHETVANDDGTMSMRPATDGFVVPAGGAFTFEAGGAHIMLVGIDPATYPTDVVEITLEFDAAEPLTFEAEVQALTGDDASAQGDDPMADMDHDHDPMADMDHDHEAMADMDHDAVDDHHHDAEDASGEADPLDPQWLHELDDDLAFGTLDADRQREIVAAFIEHYEAMAPAAGTDEAVLLDTLHELDRALADGDLDRAGPLATQAHEAAHHLETGG